jgi:hypothetical protein
LYSFVIEELADLVGKYLTHSLQILTEDGTIRMEIDVSESGQKYAGN